jgi:hypothetical protein
MKSRRLKTADLRCGSPRTGLFFVIPEGDFAVAQATQPNVSSRGGRRTFIYRCPVKGRNGRGWLAGETSVDDAAAYETVACTVCKKIHFVNQATGRVVTARIN